MPKLENEQPRHGLGDFDSGLLPNARRRTVGPLTYFNHCAPTQFEAGAPQPRMRGRSLMSVCRRLSSGSKKSSCTWPASAPSRQFTPVPAPGPSRTLRTVRSALLVQARHSSIRSRVSLTVLTGESKFVKDVPYVVSANKAPTTSRGPLRTGRHALRGGHVCVPPSFGLCQLPPSSMSASASFGPQLRRL